MQAQLIVRSKLKFIRLALAWVAALTPGLADGGPNLKKAAKTHSIVILSNVKKAAILKDGLFVGHAGNPFDAEPGNQRLVIAAPGYVPRLVLIKVFPTAALVSKTVNLLPARDANSDLQLDFDQAAQFPKANLALADLPSLCARFNAKGPSSDKTLLRCERQSIIDDLNLFGDRALVPQPKAALNDETGRAYTQRLKIPPGDDVLEAAADRYYRAPSSATDLALYAWGALTRGDCGLVMQIALEANAANLGGVSMLLTRALCFEITGQGDKAVKLYQYVAKDNSVGCDGLYLVARGTWSLAPKTAEEALARCTRLFPSYYPAYEALAHVYTLNRRLDRVTPTLAAWHRASATTVRTLLKSEPIAASAVRAAWNSNPWNFELTLLMAMAPDQAVEREKAVAGLEHTLVADKKLAVSLLPRLEALNDARLLVQVYKIAADEKGQDVGFWIRYADAERKLGHCPSSLAQSARAQKLLPEGDRKDALVLSDTTCLLAVGNVGDAEANLRALINKKPGQWKVHYNLGVLLQRAGRLKEAVEQFELALSGGAIPDATARSILELIDKFKAQTATATKARAEP